MPRTPQDWEQEFTKGFAGRLIRRKVEQVRKKLYLNRQDAEDLEQDLLLEIWRRSGNYDATRGSWEAFTTEVTKRQIATKIRKLTRRKRPVSLDADDANYSWIQALTKKDQVRHLGIDLQEQDPDLACDIEFIKQQLDMDRQMLVDLLRIAEIDPFDESATFLDELSRVDFTQPAKFNAFRFHPIGIAGYTNPITRHKGSGVICISPFVQDQTLDLLKENTNDERWLFSRREELLKLSATALDGFSPYQLSEFVVDGEQLAAAEDGEGEPLQQNLHAKLFVFRRQSRGSRWFIGSANATTAAMERNVEFMLELRGQSDAVQFERLLEDLLGPDRDANIFEPFEPQHEPSDTDQSLEQKLRFLEYDLLKSLNIESARVERKPTSENYDLHLVIRPENIRWADFSVRLAPFNTKGIEAQELSTECPVMFCFENINESNLSRFLRFEIHHDDECLRQFLMKIDIEGMPSSRISRIMRSIINDRDRFFEYLRFLLADDFDKNDIESGSTNKGGNNDDDAQVWDVQAPIFEHLLIAASRRPGRLKEIDDVIRQLTEDADDEKEIVPPEFISFWNAFRQMVPQSQEPSKR